MRPSDHLSVRICAIGLGLVLCVTGIQASETDAESDTGGPFVGVVGLADVLEEAVPIDLYTPPQRKELVRPVYPLHSLQENREGWVRLEFMVDPQGRPTRFRCRDPWETADSSRRPSAP